MTFDIRTATRKELLERADYLERFPAGTIAYRDYLLTEVKALRDLADSR
jgi:hypothetical protein